MEKDRGSKFAVTMISAVIPAYNEEADLEHAVSSVSAVLTGLSTMTWEIIIVDDGSVDGTFQAANQLMRQDPRVRVRTHQRNQGKGAAVRTGVVSAKGDAVVIMDADMSVSPGFIEIFLSELSRGVDVVIGDRKDPKSRIERPQSFTRRVLGNLYAWLARKVTGTSLRDFNCGFKLFRGDAARTLLSQCRSDRWVWDVEVIAMAMRSGMDVRSLPVSWRQGPRTSVKPFSAALASLRELAVLWWRLKRLKRQE